MGSSAATARQEFSNASTSSAAVSTSVPVISASCVSLHFILVSTEQILSPQNLAPKHPGIQQSLSRLVWATRGDSTQSGGYRAPQNRSERFEVLGVQADVRADRNVGAADSDAPVGSDRRDRLGLDTGRGSTRPARPSGLSWRVPRVASRIQESAHQGQSNRVPSARSMAKVFSFRT